MAAWEILMLSYSCTKVCKFVVLEFNFNISAALLYFFHLQSLIKLLIIYDNAEIEDYQCKQRSAYWVKKLTLNCPNNANIAYITTTNRGPQKSGLSLNTSLLNPSDGIGNTTQRTL